MVRTAISIAGTEARGFTLIELLVVLVIAGLAISLVGPSFQRLLPGIGLESEARTVSAMLRHARSQAILTGVPVSVAMAPQGGGLLLSYRSTPYMPLKGIEMSLDGGPSSSSLGDARILFFPRGDSSGGSITLKLEDGKSRIIVVDWLSGRVALSTEEEQAQLKADRERLDKARARERERRMSGVRERPSA